jgi:hypothetical protein
VTINFTIRLACVAVRWSASLQVASSPYIIYLPDRPPLPHLQDEIDDMYAYIIYPIAIILSSYLLLHAESYALKAIHPDGRLPSIIQAKRRTQSVCQAIFKSKDDGVTVPSDTIILVDGNNIRNAFGFQHMSALQLTIQMSSWSRGDTDTAVNEEHMHRTKPQIICAWDGGKRRSSQKALSTLSAYSGPDGNADDLIVQCCSFLSSQSGAGANNEHLTVVVFTSDANLANRCQMQFMMGDNSGIDYQIYHSIHLCLLLGDDGSGNDPGFAPDWEREERRKSVDELQSHLDEHDDHDIDDGVHLEYSNCIDNWINNGLKGCEVGRVTKGGSILYTCK